jgi:phosphoribosylformimino-5-aminoimidazole carboxamide ribotide isomerase
VRSIDDIKKLHEQGIFAVIIGRALYEGKLHLKEIEDYLAQPK